MLKRLSPQEKKIRDYMNQTKNCYGENSKSSRKSIRYRKAVVNRDYRRKSHNILRIGYLDIESIEMSLSGQSRDNWKKFADESLIERMSDYNRNSLNGELQKEAIKRIKKTNKNTELN
ncbi:hypothetical protein RI845_15995 [Thalassotalea nanhaiensis]|uniref:Uncharacterized protein n=1 Tax=Thalassotalea nanhaiensis TaxID=3065648 RepID=A0ABY9TGV1_9GAMM|nr:hypothetical protein RI845_15995 [Colwelliaceae bacterium SQ345]